MGELPAGEKPPVVVPAMTEAAEARRLLGDGSFGGPYQTGEAVMQELFEAPDRLKRPA